MNKLFYLLAATVILLIAAGCEEDDGKDTNKVVGTGPIVTKTLDLSDFDKIENIGVADFYITIGSPQSVALKAQQNIIDVMTYEVVSQTLKVGLEKNVSIENHEEISFDVTVPAMTRIELVGVGDFVLSGDDQAELTIVLTGVGDVYAYNMKAGICTITISGVGNCEVYVLNELNVTLTGVGNVYYKGNPTVQSIVTGVGQLINTN